MRTGRLLVFLDSVVQDLRYALRGMRRDFVFTVTALAAIALGTGATTAVFSAVDRILFRSLPYPGGDRIVTFGFLAPIEQNEFLLGADYSEWRSRQSPFELMASVMPGARDCDLNDGAPARMSCGLAESTLLPMLGVSPVVGRNFTPEEDRPNAPKVALVSYALWRGRYGGDATISGRTVEVDGEPVRVVGVLPDGFELPTLAPADLILPQQLPPQPRPATGRVLRTFARLKPGVTGGEAAAQLKPLFQESLKWVPPNFRKEVRLSVRSLRDFQVQGARRAAWVLLGAVLAVLLIACGNAANLLLARAAGRQRELAVRAALGAGRGRLVRQSLTESLLLALLGGAAGCALAQALLRLFISIAPQGIPKLQQARIDLRVLWFALAASAASGIAFGVIPALQSPRPEQLGGGRAAGPARGWFRQILVGLQVAVSLVLLAGAGLLLRSFWNLESEPLGFDGARVVAASISLGRHKYAQPGQQAAFLEELERRLAALPGVEALGIGDTLPPGGPMRSMISAAIEVQGRPRLAEGTGGMVAWRSVSPGYFAALGIPIVRGRSFTEQDRDPGRHAVILSHRLARQLFPGEEAVGQAMRFGRDRRTGPEVAGLPWFTVVGVASDVKNSGLDAAPEPEYYLARRHSAEDATPRASLVIRSRMNPGAMADWVRAEVGKMDPELPVSIETMEQRTGRFAERPRFNAALVGLFAASGLMLTAIGAYGVISFLVTQRTREMGVRMALGASSGAIFRLVVGRGMGPVLAGAGAGLLAAPVLARLLASLLFGVGASDPMTMAAVAALMVFVGFAAAYWPARAATRVDPMRALRCE